MHFGKWDGRLVPLSPFLWETGIKKVQNGYAGCACFMSVKRHAGMDNTRPHIWTDESRTPPLTSLRACGEIRLTDGMGTQGQAGCAQPTDGALYHRHAANPRAGRRSGTGGWFTASAVNLGTGRVDWQLLRFLLCGGVYGRLYGGTEAAQRPGCKDERI